MDFKEGLHFSIELEKAILGGAILERGSFARCYGLITPETFHNPIHQTIFSACIEMYQEGFPIDMLTVTDYLLRRKPVMEDNKTVGWWIVEITKHIQSSVNLEFHCSIIQEMYLQREIQKITHSGAEGVSSREQIGSLMLKINSLQQKQKSADWQSAESLVMSLYEHQDKMTATGGMGISTGFQSLDRENGGFHPGQMVIIGARPSVGKSALSGQLALQMAMNGTRVGIITLEMNNVEIAARLASIQTDIEFNKIYRNLFRDQHERDLYNKRISERFIHLPIQVTDKTGVSINEIRAKASQLQSKFGLDILILDYLQLVSAEHSKGKNREQEVSEMSRGCKIMAKELEVPVIVLCQLNRQVTARKGQDRYPHLSDLRESGSLEQDADVVMFLHRDWMSGIETNENGESTKDEADLIVRKWRNGALCHLRLNFEGEKMKFSEKNTGFVYLPPEKDKQEEDDWGDVPFK